jgi:hypothetical protein
MNTIRPSNTSSRVGDARFHLNHGHDRQRPVDTTA